MGCVFEEFLFGRVIVSAEDFEAFAELVLDDGSVVCFSVNDLSFVGNQEFGVVRGCGFVIFSVVVERVGFGFSVSVESEDGDSVTVLEVLDDRDSDEGFDSESDLVDVSDYSVLVRFSF